MVPGLTGDVVPDDEADLPAAAAVVIPPPNGRLAPAAALLVERGVRAGGTPGFRKLGAPGLLEGCRGFLNGDAEDGRGSTALLASALSSFICSCSSSAWSAAPPS